MSAELNPAEKKRQAVIEAATKLFRELVGEHIDAATKDAADAFIEADDEDATAPVVKLAVVVSFPPLDDAPEVGVSLAWSVRRKHEATVVVDPNQTLLPLRKEDLK